MAGIFINYRRDDAPGVAGRLYDHLARNFPKRELFMDVDAMKPGFDFVKQLDAQVSQCHALLAVIGPKWLNARDDKGHRRLDNDADYVRVEIASALKRDIPVIPLLVDGATMPPEHELPGDLKSLARRHGMELRHTRFNVDADAVVAALRGALPRRGGRWTWTIGSAGTLVAVVAAAFFAWPHISALVAPKPEPAKPTRPAFVETPRKDRTKSGPVDVKSTARVMGVSVRLGETLANVKAAYPAASVSEAQLNLPLSGIMFFFNTDNLTLRMMRFDAPFKGSVQGLSVGDSLASVLETMGQPYTAPWSFGDNRAYAFYIDDTIARFDIDRQDKVATIFYFVRSH